MARRRRPKRHEAKPPRPPNALASTMCGNGSHSGRQSSEGTLSERTASDGAQTAMTSLMGTDEEVVDDVDNDTDEHSLHDMQEEDGADTQSVYPVGAYPSVASSHRTEMPYLEADSFMGNSDVAASTRSLYLQELDYREIHGRWYCREWFMPIDEIEQLRLSLLHQVFLHVLGGEHSTLQLEEPTNILDIGTGTGEWAMRMAETYPQCEVVGTDIAAIAETNSVPMNVFFEVEDAEDWDRPPDVYDLIHFRTMEGAFKDWKAMLGNVLHSLKPGGWVELQDFDSGEGFMRFLEQFPPESPIHTLMSDLVVAAEKAGRPRGNFHLNPRLFMDAGFAHVRATEYIVPISVAEQSAGKIWLISCLDALEALCLRLLTEQMGWDPEDCKAACEAAAREMAEMAKDPEKSKGLVIRVVVIVGRKPLDASSRGASQSPTADAAGSPTPTSV